jgi:hypothetical protein
MKKLTVTTKNGKIGQAKGESQLGIIMRNRVIYILLIHPKKSYNLPSPAHKNSGTHVCIKANLLDFFSRQSGCKV